MKKTAWTARFIAECAMIAAIYTAATGLFAPISFNMIQIRVSEALYALALFTPAAVPGLAFGCMISNILWSPFGILDVVLGTLATLIGAYAAYAFRNRGRTMALSMPVISNALIVPLVLMWASSEGYFISLFYVGIAEAIACIGLGYPLAGLLERYKGHLFKSEEQD